MHRSLNYRRTKVSLLQPLAISIKYFFFTNCIHHGKELQIHKIISKMKCIYHLKIYFFKPSLKVGVEICVNSRHKQIYLVIWVTTSLKRKRRSISLVESKMSRCQNVYSIIYTVLTCTWCFKTVSCLCAVPTADDSLTDRGGIRAATISSHHTFSTRRWTCRPSTPVRPRTVNYLNTMRQ